MLIFCVPSNQTRGHWSSELPPPDFKEGNTGNFCNLPSLCSRTGATYLLQDLTSVWFWWTYMNQGIHIAVDKSSFSQTDMGRKDALFSYIYKWPTYLLVGCWQPPLMLLIETINRNMVIIISSKWEGIKSRGMKKIRQPLKESDGGWEW